MFVLEVCGDRWYLVQMGTVTRRVHANHLIRALDEMSADLGNPFEEGSCLQEFQSVPGPVGVQNQESGLPRTDEESSQSGVVPSMLGNNYTVPIASSPVAKETEVGGHPEMTLGSLSKPRRRRQRERHQIKVLTSKTIAVHVRYKPLYISLPSSAKLEREMTKLYAVYRTWITTANFSHSIWN